jgi:hypothetical protein
MDKVTRNILISGGVVVLAAAVAIGSFFGGAAFQRGRDGTTISANTAYGQNNAGAAGGGPGGWNGQPGAGGAGGQGFRPGGTRGGSSGTVQSVSGSTITVKLADGTVETVTLTADTVIAKSQAAAAADLAAGQTVQVLGMPAGNAGTGDTGNIAARQITIEQ